MPTPQPLASSPDAKPLTAETITDDQIRALRDAGQIHPMRARMALAGNEISRERCAADLALLTGGAS